MASFTRRVVTGIILWFGLILSSVSLIKTFFLYGEIIRMGVKTSTNSFLLVSIASLVMMTVVPCILGLIGFHKSKPGNMMALGVFISRLSLAYWMVTVIVLDVIWIVHEDLLRNSMIESLSQYEYLANRLIYVGHVTGNVDLLLLKAICFMNVFTFLLACAVWSSTSIVHSYCKKWEEEEMLRNPLFDIKMKG